MIRISFCKGMLVVLTLGVGLAQPAVRFSADNDSSKGWAVVERKPPQAELVFCMAGRDYGFYPTGIVHSFAGVVVRSDSLYPMLQASVDGRVEGVRRDYSQQASTVDNEAEAFRTAFRNALTGGQLAQLFHLIGEGDEPQKNWMFETLLEHMKSDPNARIRMTCVVCMRPFPGAGADAAADVLVSDPDMTVRSSAAYVLGFIATERHVEALYQAVKDDMGVIGHGRSIAREAINVLGRIGGERAVEVLNEIWDSDQLSRGCRGAALSALGKAGDPCALAVLEGVLTGNEESLRVSAVHGLASLGLRNPENQQLVTRIRVLLRAHLGDSNPRVRVYAAQALGHVGLPADIALLGLLLTDEHSTTRYYTDKGEQKAETVYPVQERARRAIDEIKSRFPSWRLDSTLDRLVKGEAGEKASYTATKGNSYGRLERKETSWSWPSFLWGVAAGIVVSCVVLLVKKRGK